MDSVSLRLTSMTLDNARESIAAAQTVQPAAASHSSPLPTADVILDLSAAAQELLAASSAS